MYYWKNWGHNVESFWNFWNKEAHLEFLSLLERKWKFRNFSNCILEITYYWKNWGHSVECFWNFWNKETSSSFFYWKEKRRFWNFSNCILLEKLKTWLKSVKNFWNFWNKKTHFDFLSLLEEKVLKFFKLYYFKKLKSMRKILGIFDCCVNSSCSSF